MKAVIKKVEFNQYEVKQGDNKGKKFKKFVVTALVTTDESKGYVKEMKGSVSEEYGRKYFKFCGVGRMSELVDRMCDVTTQKRMWTDSDGNMRTVTEIKGIHLIDDNGEVLYMPKDDSDDVTF